MADMLVKARAIVGLTSKEKRELEQSIRNKALVGIDAGILSSNINIGRGAIGIVPNYLAGMYVSNEYTILRAQTEEDAVFYSGILRTKEILGDILASTTGMGRGRLKWDDMKRVEVPLRDKADKSASDAVAAIKDQWSAHAALVARQGGYIEALAIDLKLDGADSRLRWLAYKAPE